MDANRKTIDKALDARHEPDTVALALRRIQDADEAASLGVASQAAALARVALHEHVALLAERDALLENCARLVQENEDLKQSVIDGCAETVAAQAERDHLAALQRIDRAFIARAAIQRVKS